MKEYLMCGWFFFSPQRDAHALSSELYTETQFGSWYIAIELSLQGPKSNMINVFIKMKGHGDTDPWEENATWKSGRGSVPGGTEAQPCSLLAFNFCLLSSEAAYCFQLRALSYSVAAIVRN